MSHGSNKTSDAAVTASIADYRKGLDSACAAVRADMKLASETIMRKVAKARQKGLVSVETKWLAEHRRVVAPFQASLRKIEAQYQKEHDNAVAELVKAEKVAFAKIPTFRKLAPPTADEVYALAEQEVVRMRWRFEKLVPSVPQKWRGLAVHISVKLMRDNVMRSSLMALRMMSDDESGHKLTKAADWLLTRAGYLPSSRYLRRDVTTFVFKLLPNDKPPSTSDLSRARLYLQENFRLTAEARGWPDKRIAEELGIKESTLRKRRHDVTRMI